MLHLLHTLCLTRNRTLYYFKDNYCAWINYNRIIFEAFNYILITNYDIVDQSFFAYNFSWNEQVSFENKQGIIWYKLQGTGIPCTRCVSSTGYLSHGKSKTRRLNRHQMNTKSGAWNIEKGNMVTKRTISNN